MGNLLCADALKYDSFIMLILGRLLVGLGGPRIINRRYIADTVRACTCDEQYFVFYYERMVNLIFYCGGGAGPSP